MISAALADPVTASQRGAQNRSRTAVRARNCRMSLGWRLSTSSARKSHDEPVVAGELADEGARRGVTAQGKRGEISPAGHPSVRSRRSARSGSASSTPETFCTSAAASAGARRSSGIRISTISPAARSRASGSGGSVRVTSAIWRGWRQMEQQESDLLVAARFLDQLIVIKNEDNRCPKCGQLMDQERYHRARDVRDRGPERPEHLIDVETRAGSLQRVHDMPPQPPGVIVTSDRYRPKRTVASGRAGPPLRGESGLAEARRSLNEDELGGGGGQHVNELTAAPPAPCASWGHGAWSPSAYQEACGRWAGAPRADRALLPCLRRSSVLRVPQGVWPYKGLKSVNQLTISRRKRRKCPGAAGKQAILSI